MSTQVAVEQSETGIWNRVIRPDEGNLSAQAAQGLLKLEFGRADLDRIHTLALKNQAGNLSEEEQMELSNYRQVGLQLDLLHSKARLSLARADNGR